MNFDTDTLAGTALRAGQLLPDVAFTDARTSVDWRPSSLRQRAAQVLCFLHDGCAACTRIVDDLASRRDDLAWTDAQVRAVLRIPADLPFPVLLDPHGRARERILGAGGRVPTIVVADRFTAAVASYPAPAHDFPEPEEILTTLRLLACDCD